MRPSPCWVAKHWCPKCQREVSDPSITGWREPILSYGNPIGSKSCIAYVCDECFEVTRSNVLIRDGKELKC